VTIEAPEIVAPLTEALELLDLDVLASIADEAEQASGEAVSATWAIVYECVGLAADAAIARKVADV
jgi:hypothetical protein